MGLEDLVFKYANETIYDPQRATAGSPIDIQITNLGTEDATNLGIYVSPATDLGDVDYPADYPPETDYQDLMRWGEETEQGVAVSGGLILTVPQNDGTNDTVYVTRQAGSTTSNLIPMKDIAAGGSVTITIEPETPPAVSARRLFINLHVENL